MFDELYLSSLAWVSVVAAVVASALGFLPAGRLRLCLITAWTLMPLWLITASVAMDWSVSRAWMFGLILVLLALPPWAVLTLLPFNLVRRVREIYARNPE